jgi:molybdopterin-guanine dinucleotide biosynthesis protein A
LNVELSSRAILAGGRVARFDGRDKDALEVVVPACWPLGGLHAALSETHPRVVVIVACDMPFVSAPLIRGLLAVAASPDLPDVVVPRTERGYHQANLNTPLEYRAIEARGIQS